MPSKTTSQNPPVNFQAEAIRNTSDACSIARIGIEFNARLRAVLSGIEAASKDNKVINDLAHLGIYLADDFHNSFDCEREEKERRLVELKAGGEVQA
jgi:hypothetical protein